MKQKTPKTFFKDKTVRAELAEISKLANQITDSTASDKVISSTLGKLIDQAGSLLSDFDCYAYNTADPATMDPRTRAMRAAEAADKDDDDDDDDDDEGDA